MTELVALHILHYKIDSRLLVHSVDEEYKLGRQRYKSFFADSFAYSTNNFHGQHTG
jgi:cell fate regulator YaaT (PSP1 superfamily)